MNALKSRWAGGMVVCALLSGPALAQTCPDAVPILCGDSVNANNSTAQNDLSDYSCGSGLTGREDVYLLTLTEPTLVQVTADPGCAISGLDPALLFLLSADDDCQPGMCLGGVNDGGACATETVMANLPAGTYYVLMDSFTAGTGAYSFQVACQSCAACVDADGDGYFAIAGNCPCGSDCNDSEAAIHPGAPETCSDGIDQDCSEIDPPCGNFVDWAANFTAACGESGTKLDAYEYSQIEQYCGDTASTSNGYEQLFAITPPAESTVDFRIFNFTGDAEYDLFAIAYLGNASGTDYCNPTICHDTSRLNTGTQRVAFFAEAGRSYCVSVDGRVETIYRENFDYSVACVQEACVPAADTLVCGQTLTGDTTGGVSNVQAYPGLRHHLLGPEKVYRFTAPQDGKATLTLRVSAGGTPPDLDLLVIEDDGAGGCKPIRLIAYSDWVQDSQFNPPETLTFQAAAGATYYVIVDGQQETTAGGFSLTNDCEVTCPEGTADCGGGTCIDITADPQNCGGCFQVCDLAHVDAHGCAARICTIASCDAGFDDCNTTAADGCEADLTSDPDHCGTCLTTCAAGALCVASACCADADTDGYAASACGGNDCNDADAAIHPGVPDPCDTVDQDCDGITDEDKDLDGDGYNAAACAGGTDCDDTDPAIHPGVADFCDTIDQDCDGTTDEDKDQDSDTYNAVACGGDDCDDTDPAIHPGATEICGDTIDQDCSGADKECPCATDADGDGHRAIACEGDDCDDTDPAIHPGVPDPCGDQIDQDCDGTTDEDLDVDGDSYQTSACGGDDCDDTDPAIHPGATEICGDTIDQDCSGADLTCPCTTDADGDGHKSIPCGGDDCDDTNANIRPGATEACNNGKDDDCDGQTDENADLDNDGYKATACGGNDCNDSNASIYPGATEVCGDTIDQDCSGADLPCTCTTDADGDTYLDAGCGGNDCNDGNSSIHPGATEVCGNGIDEDCNGADLPCTCTDADGDGYQASTCGGNDCDDSNGFIHPGAIETCGNSIDEDCSGADQPCACGDADSDGYDDVNCGGTDCSDKDPNIHPGAVEVCGDSIDQNCDGLDRPCESSDGGCGCRSAGGSLPPLGPLGIGLLGGVFLIRRKHRR